MESNNNDYENLLFYFAYKTFINTADEIIEAYGLNRQHHRFLFFIEKVPGITIKDLLKSLEISKQGSHATLKKLKDEAYITEQPTETDKRIKALYPTEKGTKLVQELNKAQNDLFQDIQKKVGNDWYDIMEEFASYRTGFQEVKYLKDENKKD
ncbi:MULTISPECIES: MarR family winged helix-turn-helix transcriptional regulator [Staphylococcus]|jgi:DNA-binding MarR family transcriptional regulator|uniref:MarR family winged helix-turn-helix transcriptional regulator n=1 Tax=Staphylococcus TaxID=1279 RepID=UPI000D1D0834|nr:MarR family winged helix-turn-helix transcriptional regulator [Staphylococcus equorum]MDW5470511.1 MarR family winged helix-turn-helix transcriptional regulator [Staphylococcus equorum]MEB7853056.1 MarR family winged helix-turn-helix transcriptional regulator [Staphylococcus equorum]PTE26141.1 MarR family transcriptional regulator [Staphylococcus equorum]PTE31497.1 MarR family transcriptional regulator [Staphylococcus equorum]QQB59678.1 winged helix-turn-helix transcriptional regulator [Sta